MRGGDSLAPTLRVTANVYLGFHEGIMGTHAFVEDFEMDVPRFLNPREFAEGFIGIFIPELRGLGVRCRVRRNFRHEIAVGLLDRGGNLNSGGMYHPARIIARLPSLAGNGQAL